MLKTDCTSTPKGLPVTFDEVRPSFILVHLAFYGLKTFATYQDECLMATQAVCEVFIPGQFVAENSPLSATSSAPLLIRFSSAVEDVS